MAKASTTVQGNLQMSKDKTKAKINFDSKGASGSAQTSSGAKGKSKKKKKSKTKETADVEIQYPSHGTQSTQWCQEEQRATNSEYKVPDPSPVEKKECYVEACPYYITPSHTIISSPMSEAFSTFVTTTKKFEPSPKCYPSHRESPIPRMTPNYIGASISPCEMVASRSPCRAFVLGSLCGEMTSPNPRGGPDLRIPCRVRTSGNPDEENNSRNRSGEINVGTGRSSGGRYSEFSSTTRSGEVSACCRSANVGPGNRCSQQCDGNCRTKFVSEYWRKRIDRCSKYQLPACMYEPANHMPLCKVVPIPCQPALPLCAPPKKQEIMTLEEPPKIMDVGPQPVPEVDETTEEGSVVEEVSPIIDDMAPEIPVVKKELAPEIPPVVVEIAPEIPPVIEALPPEMPTLDYINIPSPEPVTLMPVEVQIEFTQDDSPIVEIKMEEKEPGPVPVHMPEPPPLPEPVEEVMEQLPPCDEDCPPPPPCSSGCSQSTCHTTSWSSSARPRCFEACEYPFRDVTSRAYKESCYLRPSCRRTPTCLPTSLIGMSMCRSVSCDAPCGRNFCEHNLSCDPPTTMSRWKYEKLRNSLTD